jgi:integrase
LHAVELLELAPRRGRRPAPQILSHTPDHLNCPACTAADLDIRGANPNLARMSFPDAARYWMRLRENADLKERSKDGTRAHLEALNRFFHGLQLSEITPGHLRAYQIARQVNSLQIGPLPSNEPQNCPAAMKPWSRTAGHDRINHELGCLGQILTQARLWHRIRPFYFPLHIPKWSPRTVLTETEETRLWKKAAATPAAELAYYVAAVTNNTSAAGCELRGITLADLYLNTAVPEIYVSQAKNTCRPRKISLNKTAEWAVSQLYHRALLLGSTEPAHYLFPFCVRRHVYDPTRQASPWFLRKSWDALRKATGFQDLRPHDLRHHCITRLLESGVEPETVRAIAGHVTVQMMDYYAHQRKTVKLAAVLKIEQGREALRPEHQERMHRAPAADLSL